MREHPRAWGDREATGRAESTAEEVASDIYCIVSGTPSE